MSAQDFTANRVQFTGADAGRHLSGHRVARFGYGGASALEPDHVFVSVD